MTSRTNTYIIKIKLISQETLQFPEKHAPYLGSRSFTDSLSINKNQITIICKRSSIIKLDDIFHNNNSSLNNQIIKSLLYFYSITNSICKIEEIRVERSASKGILASKLLKEDEIIQIFESETPLPFKLTESISNEILNESPKAYSLRNSFSYYLTAQTKPHAYDKFEKYWKSFNALYKSITGETKDKDALIKLRALILTNKTKMIFSNNVSKEINYERLNKLSWRSFIIKDFSKNSLTQSFIHFVNNYSDSRVLKSIKDRNYGIQKDFLTQDQENNLNIHISNNVNTINNTELTAFITGKFAYSLRNESFHAEKIDWQFRISETKNIKDLELINDVFNAYIVDLFNIS